MRVDISCPVCNISGFTEVPDYLLDKTPGGVVAIQIVMKSHCKHSFIVYLDRNGSVRGYQVLDYLIEMGEAAEETLVSAHPQTLSEIHQILGLAAMGHILASLSTGENVLLIGDEGYTKAIFGFFDRILPETVSRTLLNQITELDYIATKPEEDFKVIIDVASRAILGTPFKAKETEWFCAPISQAMDILEPKAAESFLRQEFLQIWNRLSFIRHLLARARKRQSAKDEE